MDTEQCKGMKVLVKWGKKVLSQILIIGISGHTIYVNVIHCFPIRDILVRFN